MATVNWNGPGVLARVRLGLRRGVAAATEEVRSEAVRLILDTAKGGRVYRRRGVVHQASAPGQPPASDAGRLVNSITTEYRDGGMTGIVSARTGYAARLEYGTSRMAARPFMRPALLGSRRRIERIVRDSVAASLRG